MKQATALIAVIAVVVLGIYFFPFGETAPQVASSFEECIEQGNAVMESYPRQCIDAAGVTHIEPVNTMPAFEYVNADQNDISVSLPFPGAVVGKEFSVLGEARGWWFFEGSFPVRLVASNGTILAETIATTEAEWMTEDFVPFRADITVTDQTYIGLATLVIVRDNPSGLFENDASLSFPVVIEY